VLKVNKWTSHATVDKLKPQGVACFALMDIT
jgi:hypothetical protein